MQEHFLDDLPKLENINVLVNKLDGYKTARRKVKTISRNSYNF